MAKIKPKELQKPDVFHEKMDLIIQYILENRKRIYLGSSIALVLVLAAVGWAIYRVDYEKNAQKLYAQAFNYYHYSPQSSETVFRVIELFRNVEQKYPGSRSAAKAVFSMGNIYYRMNDLERAIKAYEDFLSQAGAKNEMRSLANGGLGYCYEARGQTDRALDAYENATKDAMNGAFLASMYSNIARIYDEKKDGAKALSFYRKALEQKNEPLIGTMIQRKIAELEA